MGADHAGTRRRLLRWVQLIVAVGTLIVGIIWLRPQFSADRSAMRALQHLSPLLVVVAAISESAALLIYSLMSRRIFRHVRGGFGTNLTIDLTTTGLSHVLPAGGPASAAARYRMLRRASVDEAEALSGAAIQATVANAILVLLLLGGLILNLGTSPWWLPAAPGLIVIAVLLTAVIIAGIVLSRHPDRAGAWAGALARKLPRQAGEVISSAVAGIAERVAALRSSPRRLAQLVSYGLVAWLCDALALWLMLYASGATVGVGSLLVAYSVGNLLALIPLTPGGLGLVEAGTVPLLIGFGVDPGTALVGVLGWRVFQFWLPIPVAGVAYLIFRLRMQHHRSEQLPVIR